MRTLFSAVAVCSLLGLAACNSSGHKHDNGHHDVGTTADCCSTTGTCCKTSEIKTEAKQGCATCDAVGKQNCATCKG